jgi:DeoR/GlpR family transcriptional regulator of sugar metabolism
MLARIAPLECVHELVTDASADPDQLAAIRRAGVQVTVTGEPEHSDRIG